MYHLYGKLNYEAYPERYKGLETDTATVVIDNTNKTISVNVKSDTEDRFYTKAEVDALIEEAIQRVLAIVRGGQ